MPSKVGTVDFSKYSLPKSSKIVYITTVNRQLKNAAELGVRRLAPVL